MALGSRLGGYLLGALVAEFSLNRPGNADRPRAALVPREVEQYATPWARMTLRVLTTALAATILFPVFFTFEHDALPVPSVARYTVLATVGIGILVCVEWLQRMIVRRPQNAVDAGVLAADDAIRASSVHACLGAGLAMVMTLLGTVLGEVGGSVGDSPLRWLTVPAVVLGIGSLIVWLGLGTPYGRVVRGRSHHTSTTSP
jgi:hypothetical protein